MTGTMKLRLLEAEYGIVCDRRSVKANVLDLIDMGYDINMDDGYYLASREFEGLGDRYHEEAIKKIKIM